ncbi:MAG: glycosyltransferase [Gammaproteobacteria bacterium]|nr:glycosyltransferase [Gammaproteobacteria bacterium]
MSTQKVSILVPNYRTLELTTLCLDLLKRHTNSSFARVIVVDNDSKDDSLEYLKSLDWITLVERKSDESLPAHVSHAQALDLAFEQVDTEFVLSIHSDTLVLRNDWLPYLLSYMKTERIAGVGSWKLEYEPPHRRLLKSIKKGIRTTKYQLTGKENRPIEGSKLNPFYLRSHCAMFRTDLIRSHGLGFSDNNENACKVISLELEKAGYELAYIDRTELIKYLEHVDHATMFLNPDEFLKSGEINKRHIKRGRKRLDRIKRLLTIDAFD